MANQIIVTKDHTVQVSVEPTPQVQVSYSRGAITTVTNVEHANTANTVTNSAQPNITSVGTLTGLTSTGNITAPFFLGNVVGNISGNFTVPGSNTAILYNQTGNAGASDAFKFDYASNTVNLIGNLYATNLHGEGGNLSNIQAANIVGNIANANFASFAGNVTGANQPNITNIGTLGNLSVSGNIETNIVYHDGTGVAIQSNEWAQLQYTNSAVAPASQYDIGTGSWFYVDNSGAVWQSNTTGTVKTVTLGNNGNINADGNVTAPYFIGNGSQLTGIVANNVANANYAAYAGQANLANTANSVNVANVVGIGNIATTNYDGNANHVLYGNGGFYALPTISNVANANYANYAGQANTANLATFATTANSVAGANVSGEVANANYSSYSNQAVSANTANYATYSGQANTANLATFATTANSVAGANVSGYVPNAVHSNIANVANTVAGANVTGVVANANYATYAGTAYSVSGSNVSGEVANANYATYAGTAYSVSGSNVTGYVANSNHAIVSDSANSVAGANVSGIVANANYAAYAGNITGTVANANYATYAGTVITNAQPNITSVGTLGNLSVTGTVTTGAVDAGNVSISDTSISTLNDLDLQIQANGIHISDTTSSSEVDVFADGVYVKTGGDTYNWQFSETGNFVLPGNTFAINYANGSPVNLDGPVANANYANFAGNAFSVNVANVSGIGNIATVNLDGNSSNILYGNGVFSSVPNTATANFANYAGNVTVNAQSNITTVGNLLTLNVVNATANSTQFLFTPNGTNVGVSGQNAASFVINQFNTQPSLSNQVLNMQFTAARGNSTNPSNVANADYIGRMAWNSYNSNTYIRNALITVLAPQGGNTAQQGSNVAWGAGSFFINTGNPLGNITSNTALSSQNILGMTPFGALTLTPGAPGPNAAVQNALTLQSYGSNTDGAGTVVNRILFQRSRGNRDSATAVANTDGVGSFTFVAYNGNGYLGGASMYGAVDTTYGSIANGTIVPVKLNFTLQSSNGTNYTTALNPDGSVTFPVGAGNTVVVANNLTVTNNANIANLQLNQFQENVYNYGNVTGTITPDFTFGTIQKLTVTGNITMNTLGNAITGRSMTLILTQDATGNRTLTSSMLFAGGSKTLSTAANAVDVISVFYDGSTYYAALSKGYA